MTGPRLIRAGSPADGPLLVRLFDQAVAWQVRKGLTAQWGADPFSAAPKRVEQCHAWAAGGGLWFSWAGDEPVAALVLGDAQPYVPPSDVPEIYVVVLVSSHTPAARGAGAELMEFAAAEGARRGVARLRVDCFAGNGGALVEYYERCGFRRLETFRVGDWPGQVLDRRLPGAAVS